MFGFSKTKLVQKNDYSLFYCFLYSIILLEMTSMKRYHSFLLGSFVATVTWCVVLYLYLKLGNDLPALVPQKLINPSEKTKEIYSLQNDVAVPYENVMQNLFNQKKKYYQNSDKLKKSLEPVDNGSFGECTGICCQNTEIRSILN